MYGIGKVARLAQVSVRTLCYYDELVFLRPIWADPDTGYRRHAPDQLQRLHRILAFRDLGVALAGIGRLLDEGIAWSWGTFGKPHVTIWFSKLSRDGSLLAWGLTCR